MSQLVRHRARTTLGAALVALVLLSSCVDTSVPAPPAELERVSQCSGIQVGVDEDLRKLSRRHPPGTVFCLTGGRHRIRHPITPKRGQKFIGESSTVVSGARSPTFEPSGKYWVATGQTQESVPLGECASGTECRYNEDVYVGDAKLTRVTSISALGPDEFFFDYAADTIYLAEDPGEARVSVTTTQTFVRGSTKSPNVVIRGLVIEGFANPAQTGAVDAGGASGWVVAGNEVRHNHATGIIVADHGRVRSNFVHHNGQQGVGATGEGVLIENNEFSFNNTVGFAAGWSAGGAKFAEVRDLMVRANYVHHNDGPGLWTDINSIDVTYAGNRVESNTGMGIFHEISYSATIYDNEVRENGLGACEWLYGAGILIAHSSDVEVFNNTVENNCNGITGIQQDRGSGPHGPYLLSNLYVHDNVVRMPSGHSGVADGDGNLRVYELNIRFENNTYHIDLASRPFAWQNESVTHEEWQDFGNDVTGTFTQL